MHPAEIVPSSLWRGLLPASVTAYETGQFTHAASLQPQEIPALRNAVPKRVEEFAAGRACARFALAELGCGIAALPRGANRRPVWPKNITGSITHTDGHCAAAAAWCHEVMSIGIDAEIIGRVTDDMLHLICTPAEHIQLMALDCTVRAEAATLIFSAKEAFYKCQSNAGGMLPGFQQAEVQWWAGEFSVTPRGTFTPAHNGPLHGRYRASAGTIFTAILFPAH